MIQPNVPTTVAACCSTIYGNPLAELLVGDSFHPGGREGTRELLSGGDLRPGTRLLDAGCGLGASARLAADEFGLSVDAVDASESIIDGARARGDSIRIRWRRAALPTLPFTDASFDAVLAECVLSTTDRRAALAEIHRVLRSGGRLLLSDVVSDGAALPATIHPLVGAALCVSDTWRGGEMDELLSDAGFRVDRIWHRSSAIITLIDRVVARAKVIGLAAKDLGLDIGTLIAPLDPTIDTSPAGHADLRAAADALIKEVQGGRLRYVALVAIRDEADA